MKSKYTSLLLTLLVYFLAYIIFSLGQFSYAQDSNQMPASDVEKSKTPIASKPKSFSKVYAVFETSMGNFKAILHHRYAPKTVENFLALVEGRKEWKDPKTNIMTAKPFYNNLVFHRVRKNFMIQVGDPYLDGRTDVGFFIKDEFHSNLKHNKEGVLSMANQYPAKDTNSTQFFITLKAFEGKNTLDGVNSIFGQVVEGLDIVKQIGDVPINRLNDRPKNDVILKSISLIYEK